MYIRIEQIKSEGLQIRFEESSETFPVLAEMAVSGECEFPAPIEAALRAMRIGDMIEVEGQVSTRVRLACGRCLKTFELPLGSHFALTYTHPTEELQAGADHEEIELRAEDTGLVYFEGETIDLKDGIQEQIVMAFPLRALCREDCKGLCAQCGHDLNDGDCGCRHQPSNGKFAALKDLKLK